MIPHAAGARGPASAIPPEDWLPVQEGLLRGLNHALSNRLASVSALAMLVEGSDRLPSGMQDVLSDDVQRLGDLLTLYRALPAGVESRRASRFCASSFYWAVPTSLRSRPACPRIARLSRAICSTWS